MDCCVKTKVQDEVASGPISCKRKGTRKNVDLPVLRSPRRRTEGQTDGGGEVRREEEECSL